jgi:uncharacterized RDD family membrane protein YckC
MTYYYAEGNQQIGPFSQEEFDNLVRDGKIGDATLVWREGMPNWESFRSFRETVVTAAAPNAPGSGVEPLVCTECGRACPADETIHYGSSVVCAECKPGFLQKVQQGVASTPGLEFAGFWIRFAAYVVDALILTVVNLALMAVAGIFVPVNVTTGEGDLGSVLLVQVVLMVIQLIVSCAYESWFVGRFGATPGKMACAIQVVRPDGGSVSYGRAVGRYFAKMLSGLIFGIGYLMAAFDEEKRALHDRLADTRVIRR